MNLYTRVGSGNSTHEAAALAARLSAWHDAMVAHERRLRRGTGTGCGDECPHADARGLWAEAVATSVRAPANWCSCDRGPSPPRAARRAAERHGSLCRRQPTPVLWRTNGCRWAIARQPGQPTRRVRQRRRERGTLPACAALRACPRVEPVGRARPRLAVPDGWVPCPRRTGGQRGSGLCEVIE